MNKSKIHIIIMNIMKKNLQIKIQMSFDMFYLNNLKIHVKTKTKIT